MTSSVDDDGTGPRRAAGLDALMIPAKSSTDSGFEAGLCVAVEAFPMASIVLESTGRIVASNRGAGPLLQRLKRPQVRSELDAAMAAAQQARSPIPFDLAWNEGPAIRFHITPLTAQSTTAAMLFLVTRDADIQVVGQPHQQGTLLSYECAPSPIRVLREEAARFKLLSEIDPLTGALNVRTFAAQVAQALTNTPRMKGAMICLDLDKFKIINDRYGHVAGDKVLIHVASKLSFPVHTGILTARMGGDEFALWVPGVVTDSLTSVIDCLRMRLSVPLDLSEERGQRVTVTVKASIGAVCCPDEALNYTSLRHLADQRLYEDKTKWTARRGRGGRTNAPKRKGAVDPAPQSFLPL